MQTEYSAIPKQRIEKEPREAEIPAQMTRIHKALEHLAEVVGALQGKINPVLTPQPPQVARDDSRDIKQIAVTSVLTGDLALVHDRVIEVADRVIALTHRVEL